VVDRESIRGRCNALKSRHHTSRALHSRQVEGVYFQIWGKLASFQALAPQSTEHLMASPIPIVPVILSGGAGTRLWPLSRESAPKPSMPLPDGETLLAKTAARALALPGVSDLVTVTNREYYFHTKDIYAGLPHRHHVRSAFLLEPFGRNTAPAVALAALVAETRYGSDAVMVVLPADHLIRDQDAFAAAVLRAADLARGGSLVTFGIAPLRPETGFGYIECGTSFGSAAPPSFAVRRFVE
jgi:mannose-1-phosphate guanylyltransferase